MPLTAYSISQGKELDVEQLLKILAAKNGLEEVFAPDQIPDNWRPHIRVDIECPCCFITGAEIVREAVSRSSGRSLRQAYFRFAMPGHHPHCDFASQERANTTPENLIAFGDAKSELTRAVRELVCTGLQLKLFSQRSIRDMREWFFEKKRISQFEVTLDPKIPKWIEGLRQTTAITFGLLPSDVSLTKEITTIPGFNWVTEATRLQRIRHQEALEKIHSNRLWLTYVADRVQALATRYQGEIVFDPTVLAEEYGRAQALAAFISQNYAPIKARNRNGTVSSSVLALAALLLFINNWELSKAAATFAAIAVAAGHSDQSLGNVMGLNPFHDYEAWDALKRIQQLNLIAPENIDPKAELKQIELDIRTRFGALP